MRMYLAGVLTAAAVMLFPRPAVPVENQPLAIEGRVSALQAGLDSVEMHYRQHIAPVEKFLLTLRPDTALAKRIAVAIDRESRAAGLNPYLVLGVMLVENPWLKPDTTSFVGATGLMQVMPIHAGKWGCEGSNLRDVDVNICHGTRILRRYLDRADGNLNRALLAYNGCVRGTNTPNCHRYPYKVQSSVGEALLGVHAALTE